MSDRRPHIQTIFQWEVECPWHFLPPPPQKKNMHHWRFPQKNWAPLTLCAAVATMGDVSLTAARNERSASALWPWRCCRRPRWKQPSKWGNYGLLNDLLLSGNYPLLRVGEFRLLRGGGGIMFIEGVSATACSCYLVKLSDEFKSQCWFFIAISS